MSCDWLVKQDEMMWAVPGSVESVILEQCDLRTRLYAGRSRSCQSQAGGMWLWRPLMTSHFLCGIHVVHERDDGRRQSGDQPVQPPAARERQRVKYQEFLPSFKAGSNWTLGDF